MKTDVLALPFDQYQRYRLVSDLVNEVRAKGERFHVLDVGGRTGLLREFLPGDEVALVDLEPSDVPGLVLGDGSALPFRDKSFDVVATFDTLEHVPPPRRAAFVAECARVAKRWVFIAGPYQSPEVEEAERILQRFLVDKLEVEHRYLEEHRHNGLPALDATVAGLAERGARTTAIGHGNLERWLALMCLSMYLDYEPRLRPLAARVFRFYNENLYASDHARPVYRHVVVGAFAAAKLPKGTAGLEAPIAPRGVLERFRSVSDELVLFDRTRNDWREERARLAQILATLERDLAGHRSALAELEVQKHEQQRVLATLAEDLEGHRASLEASAAALASERTEGSRARAELATELEAQRREVAHLLAALHDERERQESARRAVEEDLEAHRALKSRLENQIDEQRAVVEALTADLEGHRRSVVDLRAIIDEQQSALTGLEADLARATAQAFGLETALADRENQIAAHLEVRDALERDLASHRRAVAELEADLAGHKRVLAAREAELLEHRRLIQRLEGELARARVEHDAVVAAWSKRVDEHARVQAALQADLAEHKKVLSDVGADLAGHRRLAVDLRAELEAARAEQARLLDELTRARQDITGKRAEIESASRELARQDALIGALRGDLKHRWKSLKRALGPRRPTPGEEPSA